MNQLSKDNKEIYNQSFTKINHLKKEIVNTDKKTINEKNESLKIIQKEFENEKKINQLKIEIFKIKKDNQNNEYKELLEDLENQLNKNEDLLIITKRINTLKNIINNS